MCRYDHSSKAWWDMDVFPICQAKNLTIDTLVTFIVCELAYVNFSNYFTHAHWYCILEVKN